MQGVGLLALLLGVGLIFYLMFAAGGKGTAGQALQVQKETQSFGNQISGKDENGGLATDSLTFEAGPSGIKVKSIVPGGPFQTHFGLQAGDVILEIGPLMAKDQATDDATAKAFLHDAYARSENLVVRRGVDRLDLPSQRTDQPAGSPGSPGSPPVQRTSPQSQMQDLLKKVETH